MTELVVQILAGFYMVVVLFFYLGIRRELRRQVGNNPDKPFVSVIIAARNESTSIKKTLSGLRDQTYPDDLYEVIVVDDHSTDGTADVVRCFIQEHGAVQFEVFEHRVDGTQPTFKKNAIAFALSEARGEIVLTTDADCLVQPTWIESMISRFDEKTGMVAGLTTFTRESEAGLFQRLQTLEFAGLVFCGVGAVGNNHPLICNGSNLSYRREAYDAVGGFAGHEDVPSGDDDLFMQNIHRKTRWQIRYNLSADSINFTTPVDDISQFMNQRARWASKGTNYPGFSTFLFLLLLYAYYLSMLFLIPLTLTGVIGLTTALVVFTSKLVPELLVLNKALQVMGRQPLLRYVLVAEVVQIPYIVLAGFRGFFSLFSWKSTE